MLRTTGNWPLRGAAMSRHEVPQPSVRWTAAEDRSTMDELIRPGLRRAFPLPQDDQDRDERFRLLLEALAERTRVANPQATKV